MPDVGMKRSKRKGVNMWFLQTILDFFRHESRKQIETNDPVYTIDKNGWLQGPKVAHLPSVRHQPLVTDKPLGVVWHYTNTARGTGRSMAARIQKSEPGGSSAHFWVESDGTIYQSVSCLRGSWHAGGRSAQKFAKSAASRGTVVPAIAGVSANSWAVGVELVNQGQLQKSGDGYYRPWPHTKSTQVVSVAEIETSTNGKKWHKYTMLQLQAADALLDAIRRRYAPDPRNCVWGHSDLDPNRRDDPGPNLIAHMKAKVGLG